MLLYYFFNQVVASVRLSKYLISPDINQEPTLAAISCQFLLPYMATLLNSLLCLSPSLKSSQAALKSQPSNSVPSIKTSTLGSLTDSKAESNKGVITS